MACLWCCEMAPPTLAEASVFSQIARSTVKTWWKNREAIVEGKGPKFPAQWSEVEESLFHDVLAYCGAGKSSQNRGFGGAQGSYLQQHFRIPSTEWRAVRAVPDIKVIKLDSRKVRVHPITRQLARDRSPSICRWYT